MPFPGRSSPAAAAPAFAPAPPAPPVPPMAPAAPPGPPAPAASARKFWCFINGASVLKPEAEARALPPTTQAQNEDLSGGWQTLSALLGVGAAPAPAPAPAAAGGRAAFGQRAQPAAAPVAQGVPRGMFAGVENADVVRRGNNIAPGDYICRVCSSEFKQGQTKNFVITELEVISSSYDESRPETHGSNREGSRMTNFVQQNQNFASNIKEIILAVSGFDAAGKARDQDSTVTQEECEALVSAEQPFTGAIVYLEARQGPTKNGGQYTRVNWWPCPLKADGTPDHEKLFREVR